MRLATVVLGLGRCSLLSHWALMVSQDPYVGFFVVLDLAGFHVLSIG